MEEKDKLLDHDYDGIRELDNSLPPWWLNLFYITIIFGIGYFTYYHILGIGDSSIEEYNKEMGIVTTSANQGFTLLKEYKSPYAKTPANFKEPTPAGNVDQNVVAKEETQEVEAEDVSYEPVTDPGRLQNGATVFATNCVACHGVDGGGGIGPNLTDNYWINGDGSFNAIVKVIQNGVPVKGMISWKPILKPDDLLDVASHVYSLRGTQPANPKEPQGTKYGE
jgi:cytochrome c oxidase cbb3-type subunit 3